VDVVIVVAVSAGPQYRGKAMTSGISQMEKPRHYPCHKSLRQKQVKLRTGVSTNALLDVRFRGDDELVLLVAGCRQIENEVPRT
jgi:hypothetical protein